MTPLSRACVSRYSYSIVTVLLSRTVSEIFNVERDLEFLVRGHSRSLKMDHSELGYDFLFAFHSNCAKSLAVSTQYTNARD